MYLFILPVKEKYEGAMVITKLVTDDLLYLVQVGRMNFYKLSSPSQD